MQAHQEVVRIRPGGDASLAVWLAYYQRSVTLYEQIAEIDPFHGPEALCGYLTVDVCECPLLAVQAREKRGCGACTACR